MRLLPKWILANPFPALHDFESLTVIDQTARVYGAMNDLITEYNNFAEAANKQIEAFTDEEQEAREKFEASITKVMNQFMCCMDQYMKVNLESTAEKLINEAIQNGHISISALKYDPETESLMLVSDGGV